MDEEQETRVCPCCKQLTTNKGLCDPCIYDAEENCKEKDIDPDNWT